ncbi:hypothetical protein BaRGS_00019394 [Batillaria attramentaria]|uniref:Uncharacterized protein n=1 Tax=Batillaria attramentaria TaxID=370345 RepID=A0ABD0KQD6_9CAEN
MYVICCTEDGTCSSPSRQVKPLLSPISARVTNMTNDAMRDDRSSLFLRPTRNIQDKSARGTLDPWPNPTDLLGVFSRTFVKCGCDCRDQKPS